MKPAHAAVALGIVVSTFASARGPTLRADDTTAAHGPTAGPPTVGATPLDRRFDGVVVERLDAHGYTYLRVAVRGATDAGPGPRSPGPQRDPGPEIWAVVMGAGPRPGEAVEVHAFSEQRAFVSRRLGRSFDRLFFATVTVRAKSR